MHADSSDAPNADIPAAVVPSKPSDDLFGEFVSQPLFTNPTLINDNTSSTATPVNSDPFSSPGDNKPQVNTTKPATQSNKDHIMSLFNHSASAPNLQNTFAVQNNVNFAQQQSQHPANFGGMVNPASSLQQQQQQQQPQSMMMPPAGNMQTQASTTQGNPSPALFQSQFQSAPTSLPMTPVLTNIPDRFMDEYRFTQHKQQQNQLQLQQNLHQQLQLQQNAKKNGKKNFPSIQAQTGNNFNIQSGNFNDFPAQQQSFYGQQQQQQSSNMAHGLPNLNMPPPQMPMTMSNYSQMPINSQNGNSMGMNAPNGNSMGMNAPNGNSMGMNSQNGSQGNMNFSSAMLMSQPNASQVNTTNAANGSRMPMHPSNFHQLQNAPSSQTNTSS